MKILLFPIDMSECDDYMRVCNSIGIENVAASSEDQHKSGLSSASILKLPYINDNNFLLEFELLINKHQISHVYSPHLAIWQYLNEIIKNDEINIKFKLCGNEPSTEITSLLLKHDEWAKKIITELEIEKNYGGNYENLSEILTSSSYSALHRNFFAIPGQSDEIKLESLCKIFSNLSKGDILEVGSLYGRSAFALAFLAKKYQIGNLICVDPWENIEDQGDSASLLNINLSSINYNQIFKIFLNALNIFDNVGYIRKKSEEGLEVYINALSKRNLYSEQMGLIDLDDGLILLHIDGNHKYENVKKDVEIWSQFLKKDGWLLLDDYLWAFGDGPYQYGNELIKSGQYKNHFVNGDTLFLQKI